MARMITQSADESAEMRKQLWRSLLAQFTLLANTILCLVVAALLSGCLEIKQAIFLQNDGSGSVALKFIVEKQWAPMVVPELKKSLEGHTATMLSDETRDAAGNSVLELKGAFGSVTELSDKDIEYSLVTEGGNPFRRTYRFEIRHLTAMNFEVPIPFEFLVKVPGTVDETNGMKVSSNEVKWISQTGFRKGTIHSAKFTTTTMPETILYGIGALAVVLAGWLYLSKRHPNEPAVVGIQDGAELVTFCTECGQRNPASSTFCIHCGQRLVTN